jgi:hypothetical protein
MRVLITGGPRTGKTTLSESTARELGITAHHTDDLIGKLDWSAASAHVAEWMKTPGPWIIEGVAIPRALRKWLAAHPDGKPADRIVFLENVKASIPLTKGQAAMGKGLGTVWAEIMPELRARGVQIEYPDRG